jgi:hypothetical protein
MTATRATARSTMFLKFIVSRDDTFMSADGFKIFGTAYGYDV